MFTMQTISRSRTVYMNFRPDPIQYAPTPAVIQTRAIQTVRLLESKTFSKMTRSSRGSVFRSEMKKAARRAMRRTDIGHAIHTYCMW